MPVLRDGRLLILAAGAFAFARVAGGELPWFLFYGTFGLVLASAAWAWHIARSVDFLLSVDQDRLEVGQELQVRLRVDNEAILPLPWVEVEDGTPGHLVADEWPRQATSAGPLASRVLKFRLRARRRGHYRVGPLQVATGDGLGLFRVRREVTSRQTITVYPRVTRIHGVPVPLGQPFGHVRTRQKAFQDPSSLAEIRPYRPGDSPRHIHWATSARKGGLHLKEFELNATTQLALFLDLEQAAHAAGPAGQSAETGIEVAASLADLATRQGFEVGLLAVAGERYQVAPARGARGFQNILEVLARVEVDGSMPIAHLLRREAAGVPSRATVALITPRLTPELADLIIRLQAHHPLMLVLLRTETFGGPDLSPQEAAQRGALVGLLTTRRVAVYPVGAGDDLARLADLRVRMPAPGGWSGEQLAAAREKG